MAKEISTQLIISAPIEKVWTILMDTPRFSEWNPFIQSLEGNVAIGQKIKVTLTPPDASSMVFKPKVLVLNSNREFRWLGHFIFPGLFDGEHIFELTDNGDGTTTFTQREIFKGILVPIFSKKLDNNTKRGFENMNQKLKERAERML